MSVNQFSTDVPDTLWWAQQHHFHRQSIMEPNPNSPYSSKPPISSNPNSSGPSSHLYYSPYHHSLTMHKPTLNFSLSHRDAVGQHPQEDSHSRQQRLVHQQHEKETMFEKTLTPSDVGKLNRLVIPKQHAEKYFPLTGDSVEKGLLLSFEDELGRCWRFRYSYWHSSQSYVLTKGWSRYVKDKQLDAGDIVLFLRHRTDSEKLFIGSRRRGDSSGGGAVVPGSSSGVWNRSSYSSSSGYQPYQHGYGANVTSGVPYHPECLHAGSGVQKQTIPIGNSSKRRLRLFGVNLECQPDESEPSTPDASSSMSSQGPTPTPSQTQTQHQLYGFHSAYSSSSNSSSHTQMDITFSRDINQMRNHRG